MPMNESLALLTLFSFKACQKKYKAFLSLRAPLFALPPLIQRRGRLSTGSVESPGSASLLLAEPRDHGQCPCEVSAELRAEFCDHQSEPCDHQSELCDHHLETRDHHALLCASRELWEQHLDVAQFSFDRQGAPFPAAPRCALAAFRVALV